MKTRHYQYLFGATKAATLGGALLSAQQRENLISAEDEKELASAVSDTFLGPYYAKTEDINEATRDALLAAKEELKLMSPREDALLPLWVRYDFLNVKAILKGKRLSFSEEDILAECFHMGTITPEKLLKDIEEQSTALDPAIKEVVKEVESVENVYEIDFATTRGYFTTLKRVAEKNKNDFLAAYTKLLIDLYNLRALLRVASFRKIKLTFEPLAGGTIQLTPDTTKEAILEGFNKCGGESYWKEAIQLFEQTGNMSLLERKAREYERQFAKEYKGNLFTLARVYEYFLHFQNDLQTIRAIYVAKKGLLSQEEVEFMIGV